MARRKQTIRTARTSDRHDLYELSVQSPESEIDFIDRVCRKVRGATASLLREDFCGTFVTSCEWVKRRRTNRAIGVDLDPSVVEWGLRRSEARLNDEQRQRVELVLDDVRTARVEPVEVAIAFNFSYFIFKERAGLLAYFAHVLQSLEPGGVFILDAYGGSDSFKELEEERSLDGFVYVWDQNQYNPITGEVLNHIHFRFPDETELKRAFSYDWRLWTLPELQELLVEAGFENLTVYWEGTDRHGSGNGIFKPSRRGEACEGWIAYISAQRPSRAAASRSGKRRRS